MSSRFVRGWKASPQKLLKLVGTKVLSVDDVLGSPANKRARKDVFMTLGQGYDKEEIADGKAQATELLDHMLCGKLKSADDYGRVIELVLNHVAKPFGATERTEIYLGSTYHVPNDDWGRWNPLLRAAKLPMLAKYWAAANFAFPRAKGGPGSEWPIWTVWDPKTLEMIAGELAPITRAKLDAIPVKILTDDAQYADDTRNELWEGLTKLRDWVKKALAPEPKETRGLAKQGNCLVLAMDGDQ